VNPAPVTLYLVRHGETAWSLSGQHTGSTDIPLTAKGEDEARALIPWLAKIQFDRVFASPRQRANYGDYEGKLSADIRAGRPGWSIFRDGCPHGEMPGDISARADRLIARLCTLGGNIALFSHGQFGVILASRWIGLLVIEALHFSLGTASLSILAHAPAHPNVRVIALWNATPALLGHNG
jgi:broad specificity phosphatase PhoE